MTVAPVVAIVRRGTFVLLAAALVVGSALAKDGEEKRTAARTDLAKIFAGGVPVSVADLKAMETAQQKLVERVSPFTVGLKIGPAQGSGVIISDDGYVLTAAHVAGKPNQDAEIHLQDNRKVRGKTLGMNRHVDAGLIKITDPAPQGKWPHAELGSSEEVKAGQWCLAIGHPGGFQKDRKPVVRFGRVVANPGWVLISDCTLVGGDSGGPLFDMDGRVIGVHSRIGQAIVANMHVPVKNYRDSETWTRLVNAEAWGHLPGTTPHIGVVAERDSTSAKIDQVLDGGPAFKAGMKSGDIVTKFKGQPIADFASLKRLVNDCDVGDRVKLEIRRGDQTIELDLVIGQRP